MKLLCVVILAIQSIFASEVPSFKVPSTIPANKQFDSATVKEMYRLAVRKMLRSILEAPKRAANYNSRISPELYSKMISLLANVKNRYDNYPYATSYSVAKLNTDVNMFLHVIYGWCIIFARSAGLPEKSLRFIPKKMAKSMVRYLKGKDEPNTYINICQRSYCDKKRHQLECSLYGCGGYTNEQ